MISRAPNPGRITPDLDLLDEFGKEAWKVIQPHLIAAGHVELTMEQILLATILGDLKLYPTILLPSMSEGMRQETEASLIEMRKKVLADFKRYSIPTEVLRVLELDDSG